MRCPRCFAILKGMQCSQVLRALPVVLCLARLLAPSDGLVAQTRYRVTGTDAWLYLQPGGKRVAQVLAGAEVAVADSQKDWRAVTLDGWIFGSSVGATAQPGFDLGVTRRPEENLRATPAGALVARLPWGFQLSKVGEQRRWVHVQRTGWMQSSALAAVGSDSGPARPTPGRRPGAKSPDSTSTVAAARTDSSAVQSATRMALYRAPEGAPAGMLVPTTPLRVLSRSGEWSRVQLEAWVKTADLETVAPGVLLGVTSAELRADPDRYVGQTVRWRLQFIATEKSDELRPDVPAGATYLLTRGPMPERGFVYVVLPEGSRVSLESLVPLSVIEVTARVRSGRSRYLGIPVVELLTLEGGASRP